MKKISLGLWLLWMSSTVVADEAPFVLKSVYRSTANAINAFGQMVGHLNNKSFFYTAGVTSTPDALLDMDSQAFGLNDKGDMVGQFRKGNIYQAFLYRNETLMDIAPSQSTSMALDVNNQGHVVGYTTDLQGLEVAFVYRDSLLLLGTLSEDGHSRAYAINDEGEIVGTAVDAQGVLRAVRFIGGLIEPLALGNEDQFSEARDINQHGHIVGTAIYEGKQQAFVMIDDLVNYLGTLDGEGSIAHAINSFGDIVGETTYVDARPMAFLYTSEAGMRDLATLVPGNVTLSKAVDINDRGQIVVDSYRIDRPRQVAKHLARIVPANNEKGQRFGQTIAIHNNSEFLIASGSSRSTQVVSRYQYNHALDIPELPFPLDHLSEGFYYSPVLATHDNTAVIGFQSLGCCGEVYLFSYQKGGWQADGLLSVPDDLKYGDRFGFSLALNEHILVVGAPNHDNDDSSTNSGSVYLYQRNEAGIWVLQHKLTAPRLIANDYFGRFLAMDNDQLVIGSKSSSSSSTSSRIYFYQQTESTWATIPYYQINDGAGLKRLLLQDNTLISRESSSVVVFYHRSGDTWKPTAKLAASDRDTNFGNSLAIEDKHLFVGASGSAPTPGSVYHFQQLANGSWFEVEKILPPDHDQPIDFGASLAVSNNRLIVGASRDFHLDVETGAVHVYDLQLNQQSLDISLALSSQPEVTYNMPFTVSATVTNHDEQHSASDIMLSLPLSNILTFKPSADADPCQLAYQTIKCHIDTLAPQASTTVAISLMAGQLGTASMTAQVTAVSADPDPGNNPAQLTVKVNPLDKPQVTILSPTQGETLTQTLYAPLELSLDIQNFLVAEGGFHYHWFIDGQLQAEQYHRNRILWDNATDGEHTLKVQLVEVDHSPLSNPLAQASVNFSVATAYPGLNITHPTSDQPLVYDPQANHYATIELENWLLEAEGIHADWVLNVDTETEQSGHLYALEPIALGALGVGSHHLRVRLVNAEHQPMPYQAQVNFDVQELPPTLTIAQPQANQSVAITAENPLLIDLNIAHWQLSPDGRRYRWQWDDQYHGESSELPLNLSEKLPIEALTDAPHTLTIDLIHADGSVQGTQASVELILSHPVDLSLDLAFEAEQARRSEPLTLNVTVTNLSQQNAASQVTVHVPIPAGTSYHHSPDNCHYDETANQVVCNMPQLLAQNLQTLGIELLVTTVEEITAQARVSSATPELDAENQQAQASMLSQDPIDLAVTSFVDPPSDRHRINAPLQITFRLNNQHSSHQANQIDLHITLPNSLQLQGDYRPCLYNPDQRRLTCPVEILVAHGQHDIPLSFIPVAETPAPVTLQAEVTHRSTQVELTPQDNQIDMTLDFYQPSLTILKPQTGENLQLARPETIQLLFQVEQWLFDPQQTVQLRLDDQPWREFKSTDLKQGTLSDSISGLSAGRHQLTLVPQQNDEPLTDEAQTVTFHVDYIPTTESPSLSILTPEDQSTLYIDSHRTIKVDYRIEYWQYKEQTPHRWFLMKKDENNETEEKPQTVQYHPVDKVASLQFTENDLTLNTDYILTVELTDIDGVPTGISDQITFTVKKVDDTPPIPTSKKSGGQLQLSGWLLLLLWLLGCRFYGGRTRLQQ